MKQMSLENIYSEIMLLSDTDRYMLYNTMRTELCQNSEIIAYTTNGKPLTKNEYIEQINIGLNQIESGETITDDELRKEIATW